MAVADRFAAKVRHTGFQGFCRHHVQNVLDMVCFVYAVLHHHKPDASLPATVLG